MGDRTRRTAASVLCAVLLLTVTLNSQSPQEAARPRLVVVLVIDQFRADYLDRFASQFGPGGFRRLLREGAYFRSAYYPYAGVETAPGHATLATGTTPNRHGIAGNQWYDQKLSRVVEAIEDKDSPIVGGSNMLMPASPRNLMSDTLSDELRLATLGRSRVYGVALKDRAAILSTGHGGLGAYWFDQKQGGFVTSKYYRDALPGWVVEFNQQHQVSPPFDEFIRSAESNQLTVDFARELIRHEELGRQGATDFLFVGFSANDYAGHRWGPYSSGVERITVQTDTAVAKLLSALDTLVGKGNYWLVLSADHGVAPTLQQARDPQMARFPAKNIDSKALYAAVEAALTKRWGAGHWLIPNVGLVFDRETLQRYQVSVENAASAAGEAAMTIVGVRGYVTAQSAQTDQWTAQAYRLSRYPERSPDVDIVPEPFALVDGEKGGTTHGVPYTYDTHVPLVLVGLPFRPGKYQREVSITDLAPTLAEALAINPPALATGKVLVEALRGAPSFATRAPEAKTPPARR